MKKEVTKEESSHSGQDEDNSTISQVDGNMDENSNSSSKMGRSKVKPNASSSQNSDTQETDKDIDGLTNLKTLAPRRRKNSSSTSREERPRTRGARLPKAPAIAEDVMLDANSNSSAEESAGEDRFRYLK
ncbi:unnamed protein product [Plutella xylostella]|uniref:(diamondback moth) hypothetical protein n=1 Tax=Plutella xylostella TaxID=51655 RepID=A0A8S4GA91_PLUXY|nr:unnamed protein product [Plutella xylostella]